MIQSQQLNQLYSQFRERAERSGAKVALVDNLAAAARFVATTIADKAGNSVVVPAALANQPDFKAALGEKLRPLTDTASITTAAGGVSFGEFGVAETGSVVYAVNNPLERQLAMLSVVYFALIPTSKIVPDLDTAGALVKKLQVEEGRRYISFVTGPSRTADIERVLTIGVQGPKELYIVLLES